MFAQVFNNVAQQQKSFVEPALEFNRIALGQVQKLGQKQLELVNCYAEQSLAQVSKLASVQSLEDVQSLAQEQATSVNEFSQKLIQDANAMAELGKEMGDEWKQYVETKLSGFAEAEKPTVKATKK